MFMVSVLSPLQMRACCCREGPALADVACHADSRYVPAPANHAIAQLAPPMAQAQTTKTTCEQLCLVEPPLWRGNVTNEVHATAFHILLRPFKHYSILSAGMGLPRHTAPR
jgi:hypothetical protein